MICWYIFIRLEHNNEIIIKKKYLTRTKVYNLKPKISVIDKNSIYVRPYIIPILSCMDTKNLTRTLKWKTSILVCCDCIIPK